MALNDVTLLRSRSRSSSVAASSSEAECVLLALAVASWSIDCSEHQLSSDCTERVEALCSRRFFVAVFTVAPF